MLQGAKQWAKVIERDVVALWIASRDPRVPWYAKAMAGAVAAYARFSHWPLLGARPPRKLDLNRGGVHIHSSRSRRLARRQFANHTFDLIAMSDSVFKNAALSSGLISQHQLEDALHGLVGTSPHGPQTVARLRTAAESGGSSSDAC